MIVDHFLYYYNHSLSEFMVLFRFIFGCIGSSLDFNLVAASSWSCCGAWASRCDGFSRCRVWALGVRASVVAAHLVGYLLSCSAVCGIFPGQGSNPCPLYWQAYS